MSERQAPSYKLHTEWQAILRVKRMVDDDRFHKRGEYRELLQDYEFRLRILMSTHAEEINRIFYGQEIQK